MPWSSSAQTTVGRGVLRGWCLGHAPAGRPCPHSLRSTHGMAGGPADHANNYPFRGSKGTEYAVHSKQPPRVSIHRRPAYAPLLLLTPAVLRVARASLRLPPAATCRSTCGGRRSMVSCTRQTGAWWIWPLQKSSGAMGARHDTPFSDRRCGPAQVRHVCFARRARLQQRHQGGGRQSAARGKSGHVADDLRRQRNVAAHRACALWRAHWKLCAHCGPLQAAARQLVVGLFSRAAHAQQQRHWRRRG